MRKPPAEETRARYENATAALVEKLKGDRLVQAVVLSGSLSHDQVWEKSDIDLLIVVSDDQKDLRSYTLVEDGINIHAYLTIRNKFVAAIHGTLQGAFFHSFLSKSRMLYTRDESLAELFGTLGHLGERDREIAMLDVSTGLFPVLTKAEKWLYAKNDPVYSFFWIMKLVDGLARLETLHHGEIPGREVVQQARRLHPEFIATLYDDLIAGPKTAEAMQTALEFIQAHLRQRREAFAPVLSYLAEAGSPRSLSEIEHHFKRHFGLENVGMVLEWLAEQGIVQQFSASVRLMPKSRVSVEEAAYAYEER